MSPRKKVPAPKPKPQPAPTPAESEEPMPNNRRLWYVILLAVGVVLLGACAYFAGSGVMPGFEQRMFNLVNQVDAPGWLSDQIAKPMSNAVWGMVGLVVLLLAFPKYRFRAWQYAVAAGSAYALAFIVEHLIDRGRPADLTINLVLRAMQGGPGFPSGHAAVITALGLTIWPLVWWPWRALIVVLIGAEAWSRVFLGVHAPLDVMGGVAVGAIVVAAIHLVPKKLTSFFKIAQ